MLHSILLALSLVLTANAQPTNAASPVAASSGLLDIPNGTTMTFNRHIPMEFDTLSLTFLEHNVYVQDDMAKKPGLFCNLDFDYNDNPNEKKDIFNQDVAVVSGKGTYISQSNIPIYYLNIQSNNPNLNTRLICGKYININGEITISSEQISVDDFLKVMSQFSTIEFPSTH